MSTTHTHKTLAQLCEEVSNHLDEMNKTIAVMDETQPSARVYEARIARLLTYNAAIAPLLREIRDLK